MAYDSKQTYTPDQFKTKILAVHPDGVASDGRKYKDIPSDELTTKVIGKMPHGVTNDGVPYMAYMPKPAVTSQGVGGTLKSAAKGYVAGLKDTYKNAVPDFTDAAGSSKAKNPVVNAAEGGLRATASGINTVFAPITKAVEAGANALSDNKTVQNIASNPDDKVTQTILNLFGGASDKAAAWSAKHPEAAKDLNAAGTIGLTVAGGEELNKPVSQVAGDALAKGKAIVDTTKKVAGEVKDTVKKAVDPIKGKITDASNAKNVDKTVEAVSPKMTAKEKAQAVAAGRGKEGGVFSKDKVAPSKRNIEVGQEVAKIKGFKASDAPIKQVNTVRGALKTEAESLEKSVANIKTPIDDKGLMNKLSSIEKPIEIESDATQDRKFDITKNALKKIVDSNDSTVSGRLKARKQFDALVNKEFPNLYDKENAPFRSAVTSMRNALNDDIEANLPDGFGYKESLQKQSKFYEAIDNLSEKAATDVGTNKFTKLVKKHPTAAKFIVGGGLTEAARKIFTGTF